MYTDPVVRDTYQYLNQVDADDDLTERAEEEATSSIIDRSGVNLTDLYDWADNSTVRLVSREFDLYQEKVITELLLGNPPPDITHQAYPEIYKAVSAYNAHLVSEKKKEMIAEHKAYQDEYRHSDY